MEDVELHVMGDNFQNVLSAVANLRYRRGPSKKDSLEPRSK